MTLCRSTTILGALLLLPASASAYPDLHTIGTPGDLATWGAVCSPLAVAPKSINKPGRASQIDACKTGHPHHPDCMSRVTIPLADHPEAVCNDGSPGVFYVRAGTNDDINKWVIHLQGGGACRTHEDCMDRWCGLQGDVPYNANKMSSDWTGDGVVDLPPWGAADGMSDPRAANDFGTWTHVWMYYCSSDSWLGQKTFVDYDTSTTLPPFTMAHRGHTILAAARAMLRKVNPHPAWVTDTERSVPDLDDATTVLFTGTSAGAKGAIQNADWFLAPLPAPDKRLVIDANLDVSDTVLTAHDIWVDASGVAGGVDDTLVNYRAAQDQAAWSGWYTDIDAFVDQSCSATHLAAGTMDRCMSFSTLLTLTDAGGAPLIDTESYIRIDLEDPNNAQMWNGAWPTGEQLTVTSAGPATTAFDALVLTRETLLELYPHPDNNVSGVFGPRCGKHVGLENSQVFFAHKLPNPPTGPVSVYDGLGQWLLAPAANNRNLDNAIPFGKVSFGPGC